MAVFAFCLVLTVLLFMKLGFRRAVGAPLGSMSPQWIAALHASQRASSI